MIAKYLIIKIDFDWQEKEIIKVEELTPEIMRVAKHEYLTVIRLSDLKQLNNNNEWENLKGLDSNWLTSSSVD